MKSCLTIFMAIACFAIGTDVWAQAVTDDFTDGDFSNNPAWTGDDGSFEINTSSTLPDGNAAADGHFLASLAPGGFDFSAALTTASAEVNEWRFSLGSSSFNPAQSKYFGVMLMSNTAVSGDITTATWTGYFLKIGASGTNMPLELWKKDGTTAPVKVGDFPNSPNFASGGLQDGLNLRVVRSAGGTFEVFHSEGFEYTNFPATSAGTLSDNTITTSSFFGVYANFNFPFPTPAPRVYLDNVVIGPTDLPPTVTLLGRTPFIPAASENTTITAEVTDDVSLSRVELRYSIDGVDSPPVTMSNGGSGSTYSGDIPASAYSNGSRVEYFVFAEDDLGQSVESSRLRFFAGTTPISSLRSQDGNGELFYSDYYARVSGVATVANKVFDAQALDVYLQDSGGGINIFKAGASAANTAVARGNRYTAVGLLRQTKGEAELVPDNAGADIVDNGAATVPGPAINTVANLLSAAESLEGQLVGVQFVTKTGGTWRGANKDSELQISDGTATITLFVDKDTNIDDGPEPVGADPVDVVGILVQDDNTIPFTAGYRIQPRNTDDFFAEGTLPVSLSSFSATASNRQVTLTWVTESETENVGFEILRAGEEEGEYRQIGFVEGQFSSNVRREYRFEDKNVLNGLTYWYLLRDVDVRGIRTSHGPVSATPQAGSGDVSTLNLGIPTRLALHPNYPNPFNPSTTLRFDVPRAQENLAAVKIDIFNALGQKVRTVFDANIQPGVHEVTWNGTTDGGLPVPAGIYFAVMRALQLQQVIKMTYLR